MSRQDDAAPNEETTVSAEELAAVMQTVIAQWVERLTDEERTAVSAFLLEMVEGRE